MNAGKKRVRVVRVCYNETMDDLTTSMYNIDLADETQDKGSCTQHQPRSFCNLETEDPFVFGRMQWDIPEAELLSAAIFPRFLYWRNVWLSGTLALRVHMRLASNQGIPRDRPLNDNAIRQLVQRVYMANEQCFDRPLIRFNLVDGRVSFNGTLTVMDACSTEKTLDMFLDRR